MDSMDIESSVFHQSDRLSDGRQTQNKKISLKERFRKSFTSELQSGRWAFNFSHQEVRPPQSWKHTNVALIPKQTPFYDVNKHLTQISLTPILSKLAEDFVVDRYVKPGGYGATVRVILFDFKKAFDLINHQIWISTYEIPKDVIFWITDFLTSRKQRAKLSHDYFSE